METPIPLFSAPDNDSDIANLRPGAEGHYHFKVENPGTFSARFQVHLQTCHADLPAIPLRYRLRCREKFVSGSEWQSAAEIISPLYTLEAKHSQHFTLEWCWPVDYEAIVRVPEGPLGDETLRIIIQQILFK